MWGMFVWVKWKAPQRFSFSVIKVGWYEAVPTCPNFWSSSTTQCLSWVIMTKSHLLISKRPSNSNFVRLVGLEHDTVPYLFQCQVCLRSTKQSDVWLLERETMPRLTFEHETIPILIDCLGTWTNHNQSIFSLKKMTQRSPEYLHGSFSMVQGIDGRLGARSMVPWYVTTSP